MQYHLSLVGRHCESPIDYCAERGCNNSGTCINERADRRCLCPPGYNGSSCEIDPCMMRPCNNGTCTLRSDGGYKCNCHEIFTGPHCEIGKYRHCFYYLLEICSGQWLFIKCQIERCQSTSWVLGVKCRICRKLDVFLLVSTESMNYD